MPRFLTPRENHDACVATWISSEIRPLRPVQRLALFDGALASLWRCAHPTLGELTLRTLVVRVLRETAQDFPQLAALRLDDGGISFREMREAGLATRDEELDEALRFLLVELLSAMGVLTGETITPLLHRALPRSAAPDGAKEKEHRKKEKE